MRADRWEGRRRCQCLLNSRFLGFLIYNLSRSFANCSASVTGSSQAKFWQT